MVQSVVGNVRIRGISCALPNNKVEATDFTDDFSLKDIKKITNMVGSQTFYRAQDHQTTSDLCFAAAEKLLGDLNWNRDTIDGIIFVTQTPDYLLPATACVLQERLGLPTTCLAFDINMGCSGYVYGLMVASQFIAAGSCNRILLLVGDTISKIISPKDRSVNFLFGDAGTATAIERDNTLISNMSFIVGTDGKGEGNLVVPASGFRKVRTAKTSMRVLASDGNIRSEEDLFMNGSEIFNFTLERVPSLVESILQQRQWSKEDVDYFVFHQANKYMLDYLRKKMGIGDQAKLPINIQRYGNTSSASIPLVLADVLSYELKEKVLNLCLVGFGVGYSWSAVTLQTDNVFCSEIIYC